MEENKSLAWDDMVEEFCKNPHIENCQTQAEVFKVVENHYYARFGTIVSDRRIARLAGEMTKSICKKRGIKFA